MFLSFPRLTFFGGGGGAPSSSSQIWETDQENKEVWHYNDPSRACGNGPAKWGERWGRWLDALWCQIQAWFIIIIIIIIVVIIASKTVELLVVLKQHLVLLFSATNKTTILVPHSAHCFFTMCAEHQVFFLSKKHCFFAAAMFTLRFHPSAFPIVF